MVFAVRIFLMSIDGYFQCVLECSFSSGGTWLEVLLLSMTTVKTQKGHSSWPQPREDTGTAAASYRTAAFPPHTIPVSCEDVACACLLLHLLAFLSPAQELPNICFGEYSCLLFKPLAFCRYISGPILFTTGIILGLYQQQQYKLEQAGADKGFA
ncbi:hypothetical protein Anapl_09083 [Anas platyrhynchos]|uniref:Uncharacterized protein n=1 Tax=Anas platyrhynchos TaxID=8839 RepID=R0JFJ6_ANAPL|nr:hypothetical protein Anapl_09083 [Anas platyrhynchos]